jgi:carbon storage regulator
MLVLSRKDGQQIMIGEDVVVSVLRVAGNRVRIGIDAPDAVRILRGELEFFVDGPAPAVAYERIKVESQ